MLGSMWFVIFCRNVKFSFANNTFVFSSIQFHFIKLYWCISFCSLLLHGIPSILKYFRNFNIKIVALERFSVIVQMANIYDIKDIFKSLIKFFYNFDWFPYRNISSFMVSNIPLILLVSFQCLQCLQANTKQLKVIFHRNLIRTFVWTWKKWIPRNFIKHASSYIDLYWCISNVFAFLNILKWLFLWNIIFWYCRPLPLYMLSVN